MPKCAVTDSKASFPSVSRGVCNYVISTCSLIPFSSGREGTQRNEVSLRGLLLPSPSFLASWCCCAVTSLLSILCEPMDSGPPDSSVYGILQARILEWVTMPSSHFYPHSFQLLIHVWHVETPWTVVGQASLSITNSWSLLKLLSIKSVMPSNHLILCHPLLLPPSIFPSIQIFSNESVLPIRWPKYWSFSFSLNSSNEYSGLISSRIDWLDILADQETLKSLLQHHSSNASILQHPAFFIVQLTSIHDYWKNHSFD